MENVRNRTNVHIATCGFQLSKYVAKPAFHAHDACKVLGQPLASFWAARQLTRRPG